MNQLFNIILSRIYSAEVRANSLPLYGKLYFFIGNIITHRGIKLMRFATTTGRRPAATIKEYYIYFILFTYGGKLFFSFINTEVRHQVSAVFSTIAEAQHN